LTKKQNSLVEANLKIIEELTFFLKTVPGDRGIRKLVTQAEVDFSRDRKLPMDRLAGLIINMPKRSLSIEIQEFFDSLEKDLSTGLCEQASTKGAFSLQRTKRKALFFEVWNKWLTDSFYHYYRDKVKRWRGFRIQAVDGSTAYLINRKEVIDHFGTQDNQHVSIPMTRVMQVQDILNDITNDITVWGNYPFN
jgi:hypothetical protein